MEKTVIQESLKELEKEESQMEAEVNGFDNFIKEVRKLKPRIGHSNMGRDELRQESNLLTAPGGQTKIQKSSLQEELIQIYSDTIFSLDHWQEEYEESTVEQSIRYEFSPDLSAVILSPTVSSPQLLKTNVLTESRKMKDQGK